MGEKLAKYPSREGVCWSFCGESASWEGLQGSLSQEYCTTEQYLGVLVRKVNHERRVKESNVIEAEWRGGLGFFPQAWLLVGYEKESELFAREYGEGVLRPCWIRPLGSRSGPVQSVQQMG